MGTSWKKIQIPAPPSQKLGLSKMLSSTESYLTTHLQFYLLSGVCCSWSPGTAKWTFPVPSQPQLGSYFPPSLSVSTLCPFLQWPPPNISVPPPSGVLLPPTLSVALNWTTGNKYRWRKGAAPLGSRVTVTDTDTAVTEGASSPLGHQLERPPAA